MHTAVSTSVPHKCYGVRQVTYTHYTYSGYYISAAQMPWSKTSNTHSLYIQWLLHQCRTNAMEKDKIHTLITHSVVITSVSHKSHGVRQVTHTHRSTRSRDFVDCISNFFLTGSDASSFSLSQADSP